MRTKTWPAASLWIAIGACVILFLLGCLPWFFQTGELSIGDGLDNQSSVAGHSPVNAFKYWRYYSFVMTILFAAVLGLLGGAAIALGRQEKKKYDHALLCIESALRAGMERHGIILQSIGDAVIATDASGKIEIINPAAQALTGWSQEEAQGRQIEEVFHIVNEETKEIAENPAAKILQEGARVGLANHTVLISRDGMERSIATNGAPIQTANGEVTGVVIVFRDQTLERTVHTALRDSEIWYRTLFEQASDAIFLISSDAGIVNANAEAAKMLGYGHDELMHMQLLDMLATEEHSRLSKEIANLQSTGLSLSEWLLQRKDGRRIAAEVNTRNLGNSQYLAVVRDIGARKQAEEQLEQTARQWQTTFDAIRDAVWLLDKDWNIVQCNKATEGLLQLPISKIVGQKCWKVFHHTELPPGDCLADRILISRKREVMEKQTDNRWYLASADPIFDQQGGISGLVHVIADITERKRMELDLSESRRFLFDIIENNAALISVKNIEGRYRLVNRKWEEAFSHESGQVLGKTDADLFPGPIGQRMQVADMEIVTSGVVLEQEEIQEDARGKRHFWSVKFPLRDQNNRISGVCALATDITQLKKTEMERERLMAAVEQAAEIIIITDPNGLIQYVNPAFEKNTGYSREEVVGKNPRLLKSGKQDEAFYRELWETILGGGIWQRQLVNKRKDGTLYTEKATISPVYNASSKIVNFVAVKRDITHDLDLEQQLRQSQKMEAVGQLAGGVAHDFNNILQAMMTYNSMLLDQLAEHTTAHEYATEIDQGIEKAAALTKQLLMFSRRQVMQPDNVDMNAVIENLLKMLRRVIGENIQLNWVPGNFLDPIYADAGMLEQMIMNLCLNARDAMAQGGELTLETRNEKISSEYCISHSWAKPGHYVMLGIADTGCGMSRETLEHIFEPFYTTQEVWKGTGLGLATVFGIVKQHEGAISVYSELQQGTQFKVYLPASAHRVSDEKLRRSEMIMGGKETILLAEDDDTVRKLAEHILAKAGYTVISARDGMEAVALFEKNADAIALVLLDVVMPNLGGQAAFEGMHAIRPQIPALFTSGYSENAMHTHFVFQEGFQMIQKPYARETLLKKIREILDNNKATPA